MCGGTAPVDREKPDERMQEAKVDEPAPKPAAAPVPDVKPYEFKSTADIFADIEARVKRTMDAERKLGMCHCDMPEVRT
jgi:hypothetical protein